MLSSVACDDWFSIAFNRILQTRSDPKFKNSLWDDNFWWIQMDGFACRIPLSVDMSFSIKLSSFRNEKQHSDPILMSVFHRSTKVRLISFTSATKCLNVEEKDTAICSIYLCTRLRRTSHYSAACIFCFNIKSDNEHFYFAFFCFHFNADCRMHGWRWRWRWWWLWR